MFAQLKNLSIGFKLKAGFGIVAFFLLLSGITGYKSVTDLGDTLTFVTGPAWDTADGAMEGTIGLESEMLGVEGYLNGSIDNAQDKMQQGKATADEALARMQKAGLINPQQLDSLNQLRQTYHQARLDLIDGFDKYQQSLASLQRNFHAFQQIMQEVEELGDAEIEQLRNSPELSMSWSDGLAQKWQAADSGMEASIGLLSRMYHFERLVRGDNLMESIQGLKESYALLEDTINELSIHPLFQQTILNGHNPQRLIAADLLLQHLKQHQQDFTIAIEHHQGYRKAHSAYQHQASELIALIGEIEELGDGQVEGIVSEASGLIDTAHTLVLIGLGMGLVLSTVIALWVVGAIRRPVDQALNIAHNIAQGNLNNAIEPNSDDELGRLVSALGAMQDNLRQSIENDRRAAGEIRRIKVALDQVSANVMLADNERNIIYINEATKNMLKGVEAAFKSELPGFNANDVVGKNIDQFHRNPAHQIKLLESLNNSFETQIEIGGKTMRLIANPVKDDDGERLGTALEWSDRTQEVAVEREIDSLVAAARSGDLNQRISLDGKQGFFLQLGQGFNSLIDELSDVFGEIASVMADVADGRLNSTMQREYRGEFDQVKSSINGTVANVRDIVQRLTDISAQIDQASGEIASGNNNLSARSEQQAASIEQTAASMEQLTSTVRNNAHNAQQANDVSAQARGAAESGGRVVSDAVAAMRQINDSSKRIAEIVGVIDEIAFQTNLLALNASVEAARAGEQGRGFAVVATEVRNLASRSAESAREIKDLINDSSKKVETGSVLVNQTGESLHEIVEHVKKVSDIIAEIAAASSEQASGIDQINKAVAHIDEMTQQNAALTEETSSASDVMSRNARELLQTVQFFKLH
jgi:methyl-accepting chemotaxis protein